MKNFIERFNNKTIVYINIDSPIHTDQISIMNSELCSFISTAKGRWDKLMGKYYASLTHDGYGSFVFVFDDQVLELKPYSQDKIITSLEEFFMNSQFNQNLINIMLIQDGRTENPDEIRRYVESTFSLGYLLSRQEMIDDLSEHYGTKDISQEYLINKLKFPERCIS